MIKAKVILILFNVIGLNLPCFRNGQQNYLGFRFCMCEIRHGTEKWIALLKSWVLVCYKYVDTCSIIVHDLQLYSLNDGFKFFSVVENCDCVIICTIRLVHAAKRFQFSAP